MREYLSKDQGSFVRSYSTRIAILCSHCQLFRKDDPGTTCSVYPKGIPVSFIKGERVCRKIVPIEGSEGIIKFIKGDKA